MSQQYASKQAPGYHNYIRNVAVVGASGQQGSHIVRELLKTGKHSVTAITRQDSSATDFPAGVKVAEVDYANTDTIVSALKGHDALIITMNIGAPRDTSAKLVEAAAKVGVSWVLPNEWGIDTDNIDYGNDTFLGPPAIAVRQLVGKLGVSSWIAVACGHWYEYSLGGMEEMYGFDFQKKSGTFFDDGSQKINTSTWEQTGRAVTALMNMKVLPQDANDTTPSLDKNFRNKFAFVSSFNVSQKDMFESVKRVTGESEKDWKIKYESSKDRVEHGLKMMNEGNQIGYLKRMYSRGFYPNNDGDFEAVHGLANEILGLPQEDLDECTKRAIQRSNEAAESKEKK